MDFGTTYKGLDAEAKTFTITGSNLTGALTVTAPTGFSTAVTTGSLTPDASKAVSATITVTPSTSATGTFDGNILVNGGGLGTDTAKVAAKLTVKERVWTEDGADHDFGQDLLEYDETPAGYTFTVKGVHLTQQLAMIVPSGYTVEPVYINPDGEGNVNQEVTVSLYDLNPVGTLSGVVNIKGTSSNPDGVDIDLFTVTAKITPRYKIEAAEVSNGTFTWEDDAENANPTYVLAGTYIQAAAAPAAGYELDGDLDIYRTSDSETKIEHEDGRFVMPNYDVTIGGAYKVSATPAIVVSKSALDFGSVDIKSTPVAQSFNVSGANLTAGNITITLDDAIKDAYTLNATSIPVDGLLAETQITVTPKTSAAGTFDGKITVAGGGAESKTVNLSLTVNKLAANLAWSADEATAIIGEMSSLPTLTNPRNLPVTYSSTDEDVATVDANGVITLVAPGETFIIVNFAGNDTVNAIAEDDLFYTLTVQKKYTATWYVNGVAKKTQSALAGTALEEAPEAVATGDCAGLTFMGWAEAPLAVAQANAPTYTSKTEMPAADVNFYAVFATKTVEEGTEEKTASVTISDYATANSWSNGTQYSSVTLNSDVTATASSGTNTGKYYTSGNEWRFYQGESAKITIATTSGELKSIKLTYNISNTGVLLDGETQVTSGSTVSATGTSATFSVGNSGTATNGQVKFTAIEVKYEVAKSVTSYSDYLTTCPHCDEVEFVKAGEDNGNTFALKVNGVEVESVKTCNDVTIVVEETVATGYELTNIAISGVAAASYDADTKQISIPAETAAGTLTVTATFAKVNYTVTMAQEGGANATLSANQENKNYGDEITVSATAVEGYVFLGWEANKEVSFANAQALSTTFAMPASDVTITAKFTKLYTVAEAIAAIDNSGTTTGVVVEAYVSEDVTAAMAGTRTYFIQDLDENGFLTGTKFEIYNGKDVNNQNFEAEAGVIKGEKVRVFGNITYYAKDSVYEFSAGSYILSFDAGEWDHAAIYGTASKTAYEYGDAFDHSGLGVKDVYTNGWAIAVEDELTWTTDPETVTEDGTVKVKASYEYESETYASEWFDVAVTVNKHAVTFGESITVKNAGVAITSGDAFTKGTVLTVEASKNGHALTKLTAGGVDILEVKQFTVGTEDIEVVATFTAVKFYITGNEEFTGYNWEPAGVKALEDSYTFKNVPAGSHVFKLSLDGTWSNMKGFDDLTQSELIAGLYAGENGNIHFTLAEAGDVTITYTNEVFKVYGALVPQTVYLAGDLNSWSTTADAAVLSADRKSATATKTIEAETWVTFKMYVDNKWMGWNGDGVEITRSVNTASELINDGKNLWFQADVTGEYQFTWIFGYNEVVITFPAKGGADAIDNTAAEVKAVKTLENGMIIIRRGDKTYTIDGQRVR
ncbi:MAG: hypothetical protein IJ814_07985 [Paludibacteraceae bacterium]|nr:hypothetical protein [Paludibacteraceae bacterium]